VTSAATHQIRVWGYATDDGEMALTADPKKAKEWREMFRDRGEHQLPVQFVLTASAKEWHKGLNEIKAMRDARKDR